MNGKEIIDCLKDLEQITSMLADRVDVLKDGLHDLMGRVDPMLRSFNRTKPQSNNSAACLEHDGTIADLFYVCKDAIKADWDNLPSGSDLKNPDGAKCKTWKNGLYWKYRSETIKLGIEAFKNTKRSNDDPCRGRCKKHPQHQ